MESVYFTNQITLRGTLAQLPLFSHENHSKRFFRFLLEVPRLSGAVDLLPIIAEESILQAAELSDGKLLTVCGQLRSHNIREDGRRHLLVFVFASCILCEDGEPVNTVTVDALICRPTTFRRTPLGREISDAMLAVPRAFRRADYLPCIFWGRTAQEAARCAVGDRIRVNGRLQSRIYTKLTEDGAIERTAYEISALSAEFPEETYPDFD